MISGEQINAIDKAIVFLIHDNPYCRLHVGIDEIEVEQEEGAPLIYDVHAQAYKTEWCRLCSGLYVKEAMLSDEICQYCNESELDNQSNLC